MLPAAGRRAALLPRAPRPAPRRLRATAAPRAEAATPGRAPPGLANARWTGEPAQAAALEALRACVAAAAPPGAPPPDEATLRWFLLDRRLDAAAAAAKLGRMLAWRAAVGADGLALADVAEVAATGKGYIPEAPDAFGRPVVFIRAARHVTGAHPARDSERLCALLLDRAVACLPAGGDGTMLGVFDLRGFGAANADLEFARFLVDAFFSYYPKRVSEVLFVDAPWVFRPLWAVVRPLLRKYAALVRFVSAEEARRGYFTTATLPADLAPDPLDAKRRA
jgi:hypothetical protein